MRDAGKGSRPALRGRLYHRLTNMKTDAQRRAENAYRKKSVRQIVLRFYPTASDEAMYDWIKSKENATEYIKTLVAEDMEKSR